VTPLVTEAAVRTFGGSDFCPSDLYTSTQPVTVYLRWPERNLDALVPLVRLVWDTLLGEMIEWWAAATPAARAKASPVLCLVDEAARTPIPAIPEYMATVAGYGISVWVACRAWRSWRRATGPLEQPRSEMPLMPTCTTASATCIPPRRSRGGPGPMLVHGRHNGTSQGNASSR
jgi:hypothetical protein